MITSSQALRQYGDPNLLSTQNKHFEVWTVPADIRTALSHVRFSAVGTIGFPSRIFVNKDFKAPLEKALRNLISRGFANELKTWDGVFIIRNKRGLSSLSLHSFALAVDVNASENGLGREPKLSAGFVKCFTDAGMDWGGVWRRKDGMHFQLSKLPNASNESQEKFHVVVSGNTLTNIANQYKTTIATIKQLNNLTKDTIFVGQILRIK